MREIKPCCTTTLFQPGGPVRQPFSSLAGRYNNPIPSRFLAPIDCLKIPVQYSYGGRKGWKGKNTQLQAYVAGLKIKGTVSRDFCFWFFSSISFPPAPEYPIRTVSNFFENSRRYSQLNIDHRCRWHRWQMRKIFNQKNFNIFDRTPLDNRVNTYIHFCLQVHFKVSAAWY